MADQKPAYPKSNLYALKGQPAPKRPHGYTLHRVVVHGPGDEANQIGMGMVDVTGLFKEPAAVDLSTRAGHDGAVEKILSKLG